MFQKSLYHWTNLSKYDTIDHVFTVRDRFSKIIPGIFGWSQRGASFIFWKNFTESEKKSKKGSNLTPETVPGVQKRGLKFPWSKKFSLFFLEIWWFLYNSSKFWNPKGKLQYFLICPSVFMYSICSYKIVAFAYSWCII